MKNHVLIKRDVFEREMIQRNLNVSRTAEMLGIHISYLSRLLKGENHPSSTIREKIMSLFHPIEWGEVFFICENDISSDNPSKETV